jgi:hypothetical protein
MGVDLLLTFVCRCIQPLRRWEVTMWMYLGSSCPDRPFSTELDAAEIDAGSEGSLFMGSIKILVLAGSP